MACPLCKSGGARRSWLGTTLYHGKRFGYLDCPECASIFVSPMSDVEDLSQMYGPDYRKFLAADATHTGSEGVENVIEQMAQLERGVFLDYGCGAGALLRAVSRLAWQVVGFEFDQGNAETFGSAQHVEVVASLEELGEGFEADVVHMGDVIEHLTELDTQFGEVIALLKPGGMLVAQSPLEAENLFTLGLRLYRKLRGGAETDMPPYHVILATTMGQLRLFERHGLNTVIFKTFESNHPAPARRSIELFKRSRSLFLYLLRKLSQASTKKLRGFDGNRYFYVGVRAL